MPHEPIRNLSGMAYKICPRCHKGRPYNEGCKTPACAKLQESPTYLRDELEGQLHIAKTLLAEGDTSNDWAHAVREIEQELMEYDAHKGATAFKQ
jgi:hypothetical protein